MSLLESRRIVYAFSSRQSAMTEGEAADSFEQQLLRGATRRGFLLFKVQGFIRGGYSCDKTTVFKVVSPADHTFIEFLFEHRGANLLLVAVEPEFQGNGLRLRRFVREFATMLFELGTKKLFGVAAPVDCRMRGADWRGLPTKEGVTKLLRLYEVLGFQINPRFQSISLTAPPRA